MKNYREKTLQYYSMWLGETDMLTSKFDDINVIYSEERNHPQKGYDSVFDLYLFFCYGKWFISYGEKCLGQIMDLVNNITKDMTVNDVKALVRALYKRDIDHNIKYVFKEYAPRENNANVLERSDFEYYEAFFKKCNPNLFEC